MGVETNLKPTITPYVIPVKHDSRNFEPKMQLIAEQIY
jgi:hypothetical protein